MLTTVLSLFGIFVGTIGAIGYNMYVNSDFAKMNDNKLTFLKSDYDKLRAQHEEQQQLAENSTESK
ncbi:uncharacterized protein KQ657_000187 [Scheffersomyces spartinae]|uniref:Uncharacterized protein n=1 Tax=Scheffersomyces spartinae TaxID=45513 RepID=A0A9P7VE57_9ASCO|nr:uncharacterized protein KQ657_000187 [Scheffersomyces spartinae]KAG7196175.1 hypothetical protein KQ657_000187 [Scheffersomyces spartinae]